MKRTKLYQCANCGNEYPQGSRFCNQCGKPVPQPDSGRIVFNIFTAWAGMTEGPFNLTYGIPFDSVEDLAGSANFAEYGSNKNIIAYCGGFAANQETPTRMTIQVQTWRKILPDGSLGKEEGPKLIKWTNLE